MYCRDNIIASDMFKTLLSASLQEFNPTITISADQRALCINGQPVIAKDTTVFENGALLQGFGEELAKKINYMFDVFEWLCPEYNDYTEDELEYIEEQIKPLGLSDDVEEIGRISCSLWRIS